MWPDELDEARCGSKIASFDGSQRGAACLLPDGESILHSSSQCRLQV